MRWRSTLPLSCISSKGGTENTLHHSRRKMEGCRLEHRLSISHFQWQRDGGIMGRKTMYIKLKDKPNPGNDSPPSSLLHPISALPWWLLWCRFSICHGVAVDVFIMLQSWLWGCGKVGGHGHCYVMTRKLPYLYCVVLGNSHSKYVILTGRRGGQPGLKKFCRSHTVVNILDTPWWDPILSPHSFCVIYLTFISLSGVQIKS